MRKFFIAAVFSMMIGMGLPLSAAAQPSVLETQKANGKIAEVFNRREDSIKKKFTELNLNWPPQSMYIRSFKYDRKLEVWVKSSATEPYRYYTTYPVCMQSGALGPKRMEGDYQVPEGFYYINELNPNSSYHLSMGLNYPNASDRILSDSLHPGSEIYIHGNCVSVGCIPISDGPIEDLYVLAAYVKSNGQDFIPVHVFPVKYDVEKSMNYLMELTKENESYRKFSLNLKKVFDYFEDTRQLPLISINKKGNYIIN
ncbi:MAG: hypothetical protein NTX08_05030 [Sphingobacteriales bacterium]|nr:hypothetical protein [Sphingobacteriales bacterium]